MGVLVLGLGPSELAIIFMVLIPLMVLGAIISIPIILIRNGRKNRALMEAMQQSPQLPPNSQVNQAPAQNKQR